MGEWTRPSARLSSRASLCSPERLPQICVFFLNHCRAYSCVPYARGRSHHIACSGNRIMRGARQDDIKSAPRACWMLATGAADDELKNITESEHHILLFSLPSFTLQEERRNIIVKGNPVFILMRLLVLLRSYLWAPGHQGLVRSEDSCKQNSSKK